MSMSSLSRQASRGGSGGDSLINSLLMAQMSLQSATAVLDGIPLNERGARVHEWLLQLDMVKGTWTDLRRRIQGKSAGDVSPAGRRKGPKRAMTTNDVLDGVEGVGLGLTRKVPPDESLNIQDFVSSDTSPDNSARGGMHLPPLKNSKIAPMDDSETETDALLPTTTEDAGDETALQSASLEGSVEGEHASASAEGSPESYAGGARKSGTFVNKHRRHNTIQGMAGADGEGGRGRKTIVMGAPGVGHRPGKSAGGRHRCLIDIERENRKAERQPEFERAQREKEKAKVRAETGVESPTDGNSERRRRGSNNSLKSQSGASQQPSVNGTGKRSRSNSVVKIANLGKTHAERRNSYHEVAKSSMSGAYLLTRARAREAFELIDKNKDGKLQYKELKMAVNKMQREGVDFDLEESQINDLIEEADVNGDGQVDLEEFFHMLTEAESKGRSAMLQSRMSSIAKTVVIAHRRRNEQNTLGRDRYIIHPYDFRHNLWDLLVAGLVVVTIFTIPLTLGWDQLVRQMGALNLTIDIIFLLDIVKNFNTGYMDENDVVVLDRQLVIQNYVWGWFLLDLISSIPYEVFLQNEGDTTLTQGTGAAKALKLLRLGKLFRLLRVSRAFRFVKIILHEMEERFNFHFHDGHVKMLKLLSAVLIMSHWIGCLNFMLCRLYGFPSDSWVVHSGLVTLEEDGDVAFEASLASQYSWSLFKALGSVIMIGFETPPFTNVNCNTRTEWCEVETWSTLLCLYLGTIFYALLISTITTIITSMNMASRLYDEKLVNINEYMRSKRLPAHLREKVREFYRLQYADGKYFNESDLMYELTPALRQEIQTFNSREILSKVPLLRSAPCGFASSIAGLLSPCVMFGGDIIFREGTTGTEIFFISSGIVEILSSFIDDEMFSAIGDGCYFGDVAALLNTRRSATTRARTLCSMYTVDGPDFNAIIHDYPEVDEYLLMIARKRLLRVKQLDPEFSNTHELTIEDLKDEEDEQTELFGSSGTMRRSSRRKRASSAIFSGISSMSQQRKRMLQARNSVAINSARFVIKKPLY